MDKILQYFHLQGVQELEACRRGSRTWVTSCIGYIRNDGDINSTFALMLVIFCIYSSRILIVPLWRAPFVPVLSPLYMQQTHWGSSRPHYFAILLHVSSGIVCLIAGLFQFNAKVRLNRGLHRWTGRAYIVFGVICLHSLWQLQGIVGKGASKTASFPVQCFNIVCIKIWTLST